MAQLNVSIQFLNAIGGEARKIKSSFRGANSAKLEWGDPFVSRAVVLGSKYVIENIDAFSLTTKKKTVLNAMVQSLAVNSGFWNSESHISDLAAYVSSHTDVKATVRSYSRESQGRVVGGDSSRNPGWIDNPHYESDTTGTCFDVGEGRYYEHDATIEYGGEELTINYYYAFPR